MTTITNDELGGTGLFCSLVVRARAATFISEGCFRFGIYPHSYRPSMDSSNCHWQFSPSLAVPSILAKENTRPFRVGYFLWWSWRVPPPRPSVYLVSLSYRFRLSTIVVYCRLNSQNDSIPRPSLYKHYGQKCLCIRININELPLSEVMIDAAANKLGSCESWSSLEKV